MKIVSIAASLLLVGLNLNATEGGVEAPKGQEIAKGEAPAAPTPAAPSHGTVAKGKKPAPKKDGGEHKK